MAMRRCLKEMKQKLAETIGGEEAEGSIFPRITGLGQREESVGVEGVGAIGEALLPVVLSQGMAEDVDAEVTDFAVDTLVGCGLGLGKTDNAVQCFEAGTE